MRGLLFVAIAALGVTGASAAVTYTYTGSNFNFTRPFTSCTAGPCGNFTTSMSVTGSFTLGSALTPNVTFQDIASQVIAYSFSNGITTFTNKDPNARLFEIAVSTDANALLTNALVILEVWQSGTSPHAVGDRFALLQIAPGISAGANNAPCSAVANLPSGAADVCTGVVPDAATSIGSTTVGGTWSAGATPVATPALGEVGTACLAILLMISAWLRMRRQEEIERADPLRSS